MEQECVCLCWFTQVRRDDETQTRSGRSSGMNILYGAVGESGGRRDGWDESDLIKFLRVETLKMIRREVREVQEDSEGGGGGQVGKWGLRCDWPRMHVRKVRRNFREASTCLEQRRHRSLSALPAGWLEEKGFCSSEDKRKEERKKKRLARFQTARPY